MIYVVKLYFKSIIHSVLRKSFQESLETHDKFVIFRHIYIVELQAIRTLKNKNDQI